MGFRCAELISGDVGGGLPVSLVKCQIREQETPEEIAAIRAALIEGERSGYSERTVDEIREKARARQKMKKHG